MDSQLKLPTFRCRSSKRVSKRGVMYSSVITSRDSRRVGCWRWGVGRAFIVLAGDEKFEQDLS